MDWILGFGAMAHIGMMTKKWKFAGYFGLLMQIFWVIFAINTSATGLLVSCIGFTLMHCNTIWQWHLKDVLTGKVLEPLKNIPGLPVTEQNYEMPECKEPKKPTPPERPKIRKITESFGCVIHDTSLED